MGYFKNTDAKLKELLAKNPQYTRSAYPGMKMGIANQTFSSQMPGTQQFKNNLLSSQGNSLSFINKNATDASQALALAAGVGGQTDQAIGDLQLQEAEWKKFGLNNLNEAYGAMADEDRYVNENKNLNYQNEVQLEGAIAANKYAKRRALWDTVGGIANIGTSLITGGIKIPKIGGTKKK